MGYILTYLFMALIAFGCVGGYSFYQKCKAIYKEDLGE